MKCVICDEEIPWLSKVARLVLFVKHNICSNCLIHIQAEQYIRHYKEMEKLKEQRRKKVKEYIKKNGGVLDENI